MFLAPIHLIPGSLSYTLWAAPEKVNCITQDVCICVCVCGKFCLYPYLSLGIPSIPSTQGDVNSVLAYIGPFK